MRGLVASAAFVLAFRCATLPEVPEPGAPDSGVPLQMHLITDPHARWFLHPGDPDGAAQGWVSDAR